jgi:hypothetical protein
MCGCSLQILAKEVVNMRRTVTKLAVNKATLLSLSNQMTEQLGALTAQKLVKIQHSMCMAAIGRA